MTQQTRKLRHYLLMIAALALCLLPFAGMRAHALTLVDDAYASIELYTAGAHSSTGAPQNAGAVSAAVLNAGSGTKSVSIAADTTIDSVAGAAKMKTLAGDCKMFVPYETYLVRLTYTADSKNYYYASTTVFHCDAKINGSETPVAMTAYGLSSGNPVTRTQMFKLVLPSNGVLLNLRLGSGSKTIGLTADESPLAEGNVHKYTLPDDAGIRSWKISSLNKYIPYCTLAGWSAVNTNNASDVLFKGGETLDWHILETKTDKPELYAVWTPVPMTVTLYANDGTGKSAKVSTTAQEKFVPDSKTFTAAAGYVLKGWAETPDGTTQESFDLRADTANAKYYAIWDYTVSFMANGGSGSMAAQTSSNGKFTLPACTFTAPAGKKFKGWSTKSNGAVAAGSIDVDQPVNLYAIWEDDPAAEIGSKDTSSDTGSKDTSPSTGTKDTSSTGTKDTTSGSDTKSTTAATAAKIKKNSVVTDKTSAAKYKVTNVSKRTVEYTAPTKRKAKIVIPNTIKISGKSYKVTSIAAKAFRKDKKITSVKIGSNVTKIGSKAFSMCPKLNSVTIGKNVTTIGSYAFYQCTALKKITIPAKVKTIDMRAFAGCKKLASITIKSTGLTSAKTGKQIFKNISAKAKIKVPSKKVKDYTKLLKARSLPKAAKISK